MRKLDFKLVGKKYNRITVIGEPRFDLTNSGTLKPMAICHCDCGNIREFDLRRVKGGYAKSCGCINRERCTTHGFSKTPLYSVWLGMKSRCNWEVFAHYHRYGGRGITVCDEWEKSYEVFHEWAMSNGWKKGLQIDRKNNDLGYFPLNCRITTSKVNNNNRSTSRFIEYGGEIKTLAQWAEMLGITGRALSVRIQKMPLDKAMTARFNYKRPDAKTRSKLSFLDAEKIREIRATGLKVSKIAEKYEVSVYVIEAIIYNKTFKNQTIQ
jgi:hypothetical protein